MSACTWWENYACMCQTECEEPCAHEHFIEDEWGNRLCVRCDYEWWVGPL